MRLTLLPSRFAVCRLDAAAELPDWPQGDFVSVTRTAAELSIVCDEKKVPADSRAEKGWRALKVAGPLAFTQIGVLSALAGPLAAAGIAVFVVSTFDTDYLFVKEERLSEAVKVLETAGHITEAKP